MFEIEVQNETRQTQHQLRFAAVPRIGEGIRLCEPNGFWVSYDVIDLWYQKAEYGDVWVPFLHVRLTAGEQDVDHSPGALAEPEPDPMPASAPTPGLALVPREPRPLSA